jgi:ribonuclease HI
VVRRGACPAYTRSANEAELAAIFAALYLARKTWGPAVRGLVVKTDSQAAISLLRTAVLSDRVRRRAPGAARLHERIRGFAIEHGIELELRWVQGHQKTNTMRAYLNAQCDRLAREARRALKQAVRPASGTGDSAVAAPGPSPPVVSLHRSRKQKRRERRARARAKKRRAMLRVLP